MGYPKKAIIKPTIKSVNGIINAFLIFKASDRYFLSELMYSNDFPIQNNIIFTKIKSKQYNVSASNEMDYLQQIFLNKEELK